MTITNGRDKQGENYSTLFLCLFVATVFAGAFTSVSARADEPYFIECRHALRYHSFSSLLDYVGFPKLAAPTNQEELQAYNDLLEAGPEHLYGWEQCIKLNGNEYLATYSRVWGFGIERIDVRVHRDEPNNIFDRTEFGKLEGVFKSDDGVIHLLVNRGNMRHGISGFEFGVVEIVDEGESARVRYCPLIEYSDNLGCAATPALIADVEGRTEGLCGEPTSTLTIYRWSQDVGGWMRYADTTDFLTEPVQVEYAGLENEGESERIRFLAKIEHHPDHFIEFVREHRGRFTPVR